MRRVVVVALGVLLLTSLLASPAVPGGRVRHVEREYSGGSGQFNSASCDASGGRGFGSPTVIFGTLRGEKTAHLEIRDEGPGQAVLAQVTQRKDGTGGRVFCGETEVRIKGGKRLYVTLSHGFTEQEGVSIVTSGVVVADFYRS